MRPTQTTLTINKQFQALAPRAPFNIGSVELIRSAHRVFNTETMITFRFDGYDQAGGISCDQTHTLEFSVIYDYGSDTYTWSFSLINDKDGSALHGELDGMYWTQFEDLAGLVTYALETQNA